MQVRPSTGGRWITPRDTGRPPATAKLPATRLLPSTPSFYLPTYVHSKLLIINGAENFKLNYYILFGINDRWFKISALQCKFPYCNLEQVKGTVSRELWGGIAIFINRKLFSIAIVAHHTILTLLKRHFAIYKIKYSVLTALQFQIIWTILDAGLFKSV